MSSDDATSLLSSTACKRSLWPCADSRRIYVPISKPNSTAMKKFNASAIGSVFFLKT